MWPNPQFPADLLTFTKEILNGNLHFLCSVSIRNAYSDKASITCGVPQGSILGPLLFFLYINDMVQAVDSELLLYADDSCLVLQHKNIKTTEKYLNKLRMYFLEDKTKSILFSPKHRSKTIGQIHISYKDIRVKQNTQRWLILDMYWINA